MQYLEMLDDLLGRRSSLDQQAGCCKAAVDFLTSVPVDGGKVVHRAAQTGEEGRDRSMLEGKVVVPSMRTKILFSFLIN
jgi:hypothetical protein